MKNRILTVLFLIGFVSITAFGQAKRQNTPKSQNIPPTIDGVQILPPTSIWNTPVDSLPVQRPVDPIFDHGGHNVHIDFGTVYNGLFNGIPVNVVSGSTSPQVRVTVTTYASESDSLPLGDQHSGYIPVPFNAALEGDPTSSPTWNVNDDHHLIVIDSDTHVLHELYNVFRQLDGSLLANVYSRWDLNSNALRPDGWTSADAAGLPITPGLVRYDQVQECLAIDPEGLSCTLGHALRFTLDLTHGPHIWPARHDANSGGDLNPPLGLRVRLKANVSTSPYSPVSRIIMNTLKKYGALLSDNGGDWFFQGSPDPRWNDDDLHLMVLLVPAETFEVVDTSGWIVDPNSGEADVRPGKGRK